MAYEQQFITPLSSLVHIEVQQEPLFSDAPATTQVINQPATVYKPAIRVDPPEPPPEVLPEYYDIWLKMADCESNSIWDINTGNGFYGGLQFTRQSWNAVGGQEDAPRADLATPMQQINRANLLRKIQGWRAWPACARRLGLI